MSVVLFVSPHLDDVVLSCPGRVLAELAAGNRAVVATVFSRVERPERLDEDRAALALLGAEPLWLGLADAPLRNPFYRSFRAIVLGDHPQDAADGAAVATKLTCLCQSIRPARCYLPLGVGTHIDHRLTHAAAAAIPPGIGVAFYEDRPYAFVRHQVEMRVAESQKPHPPGPPLLSGEGGDPLGNVRRPSPRLRSDLPPLRLGVGGRGGEVTRAAFLASFRAAGYVRGYLPEGPERDWCEPELLRRLESALAQPPADHLEPELAEYSQEVFDRAAAAVAAYASQIPELFGDLAGYQAATREYTALLGSAAPYAERFWRLTAFDRRPPPPGDIRPSTGGTPQS